MPQTLDASPVRRDRPVPGCRAAATTDSSRVINHRFVPPPGSFTIDPVHTFVVFRAQHLIIGRVHGRFDDVTGVVGIGEEPLQSTVEVDVATASISTLKAVREDDLRSARYLDVAQYPTMNYRSLSVAELASGNWSVAGALTIRDTTRQVELIVAFAGSIADPMGNERIAFHATGSISRKDFGLTTELEKESGGVAVARDVAINVDAELIRPL